ncbi:MAG: flagellar type III secretion system protein FlhB [Acidobacteria bacterium]|nr:flagellar type III secretion system protein FlhB [Acidobacteriota bacterium]
MSGQKTEQPTPKKLQDARKKGQVPKSQDLTNAFLFMTAAGTLGMIGASLVERLEGLILSFLDERTFQGDAPPSELLSRAGEAFWTVILAPLPVLAGMAAVSLLIGFVQVRGLFAPEAIKPDIKKLNPLDGFKNIFAKPKTYIELGKNLLKFAVVLGIVYANVKSILPELLLTPRARPEQVLPLVGDLLSDLLLQIGTFFLALGAADFILQQKLHLKELMMTKDEVKREFKSDEGDPLIKGQRQQLHHDLLSEGSIAETAKADVVVVNPTHLAVALRYVEATMSAPRVTAKGQDERAKEILKLARRHDVPILRNIPLARGLIKIEIGHEVPEELYAAVAEVLNWVYQLRQAEAEEA